LHRKTCEPWSFEKKVRDSSDSRRVFAAGKFAKKFLPNVVPQFNRCQPARILWSAASPVPTRGAALTPHRASLNFGINATPHLPSACSQCRETRKERRCGILPFSASPTKHTSKEKGK
jgi:hypothetical protein